MGEITYNGRTQSTAAWARELGLSFNGLKARLRRMPIEQALSTPRPARPDPRIRRPRMQADYRRWLRYSEAGDRARRGR